MLCDSVLEDTVRGRLFSYIYMFKNWIKIMECYTQKLRRVIVYAYI